MMQLVWGIDCSQCVVILCVWGSVCHFMAEGSCYYYHTVGGGVVVGGPYMYMHVHVHVHVCTFADAYDTGYYVCQTMYAASR